MASYTVQHTLPSHEEISERFPVSEKLKEKIKQDRIEIEDILSGKDSRKFMIVGPCSSWPSESVIEYARKLAPLAEKTKDVLKIIMRTYVQKPRTVAGWMGPLVQPDPFAEPHIPNGISYCREMMQDFWDGLLVAHQSLPTPVTQQDWLQLWFYQSHPFPHPQVISFHFILYGIAWFHIISYYIV